jgi:hypothetical protein
MWDTFVLSFSKKDHQPPKFFSAFFFSPLLPIKAKHSDVKHQHRWKKKVKSHGILFFIRLLFMEIFRENCKGMVTRVNEFLISWETARFRVEMECLCGESSTWGFSTWKRETVNKCWSFRYLIASGWTGKELYNSRIEKSMQHSHDIHTFSTRNKATGSLERQFSFWKNTLTVKPPL